MTLTDSGASIVDLIRSDHEQMRELLARFEATPADRRAEYLCEVTHTLVRHEVAEEMVVYPAIRSDARQGGAEADRRIEEQSKAEQLLADLAGIDSDSQEFSARFIQLREAVLEHAAAEERSALPLLESAEADPDLKGLGRRYEQAREKAPTHPHPHAKDTPPLNRMVGPVAALFDRARDAMKR